MRRWICVLAGLAAGVCGLALTRQVDSGADVTSAVAVQAAGVPDMTCKPSASGDGTLPPEDWNDCVGTFTYSNGNIYRGGYQHGERVGLGMLEIKFTGPSNASMIGWKQPALYIGNFARSRLNGHGLLIEGSGAAYTGTFKDNIAQPDLVQKQCTNAQSAAWTGCIGVLKYPDGNIYRGEFANGQPDGIGMLEINAVGTSDATEARLPAPGTYVGQFKGGKLDGQGVITMTGTGFQGAFRDNHFEPTAARPVTQAGP